MAPESTTTTITTLGQYKVVSLALDLTGKKLYDEICQVGAYCLPDEKSFSQYVMPFRDVSLSSTRNHGVRVFTTFGKYRVLKEVPSGKTLKTKSEYTTLVDFMQWLKEIKGDSDGIFLAYHDNNREAVTSFLLEALSRYNFADDFFNTVPGFVNVEKVAEELAKQEGSELHGKALTLRALSKHLLTNDQVNEGINVNSNVTTKKNKQVSMQSAKKRAKFTYLVLQKLLKTDGELMSNELLVRHCINRDEVTKCLEKQKRLAEEKLQQQKLIASAEETSDKDKISSEEDQPAEKETLLGSGDATHEI